MIRAGYKHSIPVRSNLKLARSLWGALPIAAVKQLKELTAKFRLSVAAGDLQLLDGRWYVTHSGLLRIAQRRRCTGIRTSVDRRLSDSNSNRWVFKATAYTAAGPKGFVGYGDADPGNVSALVRGAEMRVAETRAVNRALRKAYGIGLCSVEELGSLFGPPTSSLRPDRPTRFHVAGASNNGHQPRLRDQLCLLIRLPVSIPRS